MDIDDDNENLFLFLIRSTSTSAVYLIFLSRRASNIGDRPSPAMATQDAIVHVDCSGSLIISVVGKIAPLLIIAGNIRARYCFTTHYYELKSSV